MPVLCAAAAVCVIPPSERAPPRYIQRAQQQLPYVSLSLPALAFDRSPAAGCGEQVAAQSSQHPSVVRGVPGARGTGRESVLVRLLRGEKSVHVRALSAVFSLCVVHTYCSRRRERALRRCSGGGVCACVPSCIIYICGARECKRERERLERARAREIISLAPSSSLEHARV